MSSNTGKPGPAAGRERGAASQRTRNRILEAALRLFNERGTAAASTNLIAAEAGISPGNLYYHFGDKQEIIRAPHAQYAAAHEGRWEPSPQARDNLAAFRGNVTAGMVDAERATLLHAASKGAGCEAVLALAEMKETWDAWPSDNDPWDEYD